MSKPISLSDRPGAARLALVGATELSLNDCYQCGKCSAGCPVASVSDLLPHRIVRLAQLGQNAEPMSSEHIWYCTGCGTCSSRCPNEVDVAGLMDRLKGEALHEVVPLGDAKIAEFHALFNRTVCKFGRSYELGTLRRLKSPREMLSQVKLGLRLIRRGKLKIRASKIRDRASIKELFRRAGVGG